MAPQSAQTRGGFRERLAHEMKQYLIIAAYLAVFFGSFTSYRRLILAQFDISYAELGWAIIKALVLGKVILIGELLHVGERYQHRPLIVSVLWKTLAFAVLIAAFGVLERLVGAVIHHRPVWEEFQVLAGSEKYEFFARVELQTLALIPLFAFRELARVLGEGKLEELFFRGTAALRPAAER